MAEAQVDELSCLTLRAAILVLHEPAEGAKGFLACGADVVVRVAGVATGFQLAVAIHRQTQRLSGEKVAAIRLAAD